MKNLITMMVFINVFIISDGFCQRQITVDVDQEIAPIKDLLGVNREPTNYVLGYKEAGVTMVRMHDDRVNDYYNYTDFWN
ncbi:MAG TPA: hypothetical protein EYP60_07230, partial [bacterium (Candidatus Stahlbacteria)]|nr:hypothetical protein [Candidatus Stahlbacteria bacterium]